MLVNICVESLGRPKSMPQNFDIRFRIYISDGFVCFRNQVLFCYLKTAMYFRNYELVFILPKVYKTTSSYKHFWCHLWIELLSLSAHIRPSVFLLCPHPKRSQKRPWQLCWVQLLHLLFCTNQNGHFCYDPYGLTAMLARSPSCEATAS